MKKLETGLSGCKLELIDSNTLRKYSSSESYNKRLDLQVKKQQLFSTQVFRNIETHLQAQWPEISQVIQV